MSFDEHNSTQNLGKITIFLAKIIAHIKINSHFSLILFLRNKISILCHVTLGLDDHPHLLGHRIAQLPVVVLGHVLGPSYPEPGGPDAAEGQLLAEYDLAPGL